MILNASLSLLSILLLGALASASAHDPVLTPGSSMQRVRRDSPLSHARAHAHLAARQSAQQIAEAAALQAWNDAFQAMNAAWQQAAIAALNQGLTPPTFDEYAAAHGGLPVLNFGDASGTGSGSGTGTGGDPGTTTTTAATTTTTLDTGASTSTSSAAPASTSSDGTGSGTGDGSGGGGGGSGAVQSAASQATGGSTPSPTPNAGSNAAASSVPVTTPSNTTAPAKMQFSGKATFYDPSVGYGSCGWIKSSKDMIVALNTAQMSAKWPAGKNPNHNPLCGKKVLLRNGNGKGKVVSARITDTCPGCQGAHSMDMSPALFDKLATKEQRTQKHSFTVQWSFA